MARVSVDEVSYGTLWPNQNRRVIQMDKTIHMLNPKQNPFLVISNLLGKDTVNGPKYEWFEDENFVARSFTAEVVLETLDAQPVLAIKFNGEDWQALESMPLEHDGTDHATGDLYLEIRDSKDEFDGGADTTRDYVKGYLKKSVWTNAKHATPLAGTSGTDSTTNVLTHAIVISDNYATDLATIQGGEVDMDISAASIGSYFLADGDTVYVKVMTPQMVADYYAEGTGMGVETRKRVQNFYNFTQIFKTPLSVTNTMLATQMYGGNERARLRAKKSMQHASDIETAIMLQGGGTEGNGGDWGVILNTQDNPKRKFKGLGVGITDSTKAGLIVSRHGGWNADYQFSYGTPTYDNFEAITEKLFDDTMQGSDTKIFYCGRRWQTVFSQMIRADGSGFQVNVPHLAGATGLKIRRLSMAHGDILITPHPMFRGYLEDFAVAIDPKNVKLCPLTGRDTFMRTNIQSPDVDGVIDELLTEIGIKLLFEHTHAVLKLVA